MRRHGLTLIETVAALALLSALVLASSSWTVTALATERQRSASSAWDDAAAALMRRIATDLAGLDRNPDARAERVRLDRNALLVRTRRAGFGAVEVRYELKDSDGTILQHVRPLEDGSEALDPEVVLGDVGTWEAALQVPDPESPTAVLTLSVARIERAANEHRWTFDRGRP